MNKRILTTGIVALSVLLPLQAEAASFDEIYVFGDSLSDTGNVFAASGNTFPPAPYFDGRFSNGQIWVENLAQKLNLPVNPNTNFAFGGATTGTDNTINPALPALQQEVLGYLNFLSTNGLSADPDALYTVWAGANDYLPTESTTFVPYTEPTVTVNNIANVVSALAGVGAKNILVVNLPDLGELPLTNTTPLADNLNILTQAHNTLLSQTLDSLPLASDVDIFEVDINSLFRTVLNDPTRYNFTNVTEPCFDRLAGTLCSNPDEYFFWDPIHPTAATHRLIGDFAAESLGVPEPSFAPAVMAIGFWGVSQVLRRHRQKR